MSYANPGEVATRLMRSLTAAEIAAVSEWLDDVEADILAVYPDILSSDAPRLRKLKRIECAVVIRQLTAPPAGVIQHSEGLGDFNQSDTYARPTIRAVLSQISDEELASLAELVAPTPEAFTIIPSDA